MQKTQKEMIGARIENADFLKLQQIANQQNCKISDVVRTAIKQFLNKDEKNETEEIKEMLNQIESRIIKRIGTYKKDNGDILDQMAGAITQILNK